MKVKPSSKGGGVTMELDPSDEKLMQGTLGSEAKGPSPLRLRTILAPVDFSDYSAKALDYVRAFANQFEAQVVLMHVVEPAVIPDNFGIVPPSYEEISSALVKSAEERLAQLGSELVGNQDMLKVFVRTGRPSWEIVRLAEEVEADLVIITTHGYTGLKHVLMGSTAELIVRHAPCPVLTVRHPEHDFVVPTGD